MFPVSLFHFLISLLSQLITVWLNNQILGENLCIFPQQICFNDWSLFNVNFCGIKRVTMATLTHLEDSWYGDIIWCCWRQIHPLTVKLFPHHVTCMSLPFHVTWCQCQIMSHIYVLPDHFTWCHSNICINHSITLHNSHTICIKWSLKKKNYFTLKQIHFYLEFLFNP